MAVIKDSDIRKEIKTGKLRPIYFLYGPEQFKVRELWNALLAALGEGVERKYFHADEWNLDDFLAACRMPSLFEPKQALLVRNADSIHAKEWESLFELLESPPESATLLFQAEALDNRKKHAQALAKAGAEVGLIRCDFPDEREFFAWGRELTLGRGKKIAAPALQVLWERVGPSLSELDQALEKAALYGLESATIEVAHVEAVVARTRQEAVFAFSDAVNSGDRKAALECLAQLCAQGEEPIAIVALLARQYRWMIEIAARLEARERPEEISRALGLFPRIAKALHSGAKRLGRAGIDRGLQVLRETDRTLKSSAEPGRLALERMAFELFR